MIVLDTNVVSELMRPTPDTRVRDWVDRHPTEDVWLTAMTAAELLAGVAVLPSGARKRHLGAALSTLLTELFASRILPFHDHAAVQYATVIARRREAGSPIGTADAIIAATCLAAGANQFATRNTADFTDLGLQLVNPWSASAA